MTHNYTAMMVEYDNTYDRSTQASSGYQPTTMEAVIELFINAVESGLIHTEGLDLLQWGENDR